MVSDPVVLVYGMSGAGKSTLAAPLAASLRLTLLSKDVIKEQLYDSLPPAEVDPLGVVAHSWCRLDGAAVAVGRARSAGAAGANFRPRSRYERERLAGLGRPIVEVHYLLRGVYSSRPGAADRVSYRPPKWDEHGRPRGPVVVRPVPRR